MKFYRTLCLAAAIAVPQIMPATESVPPRALGQVEATVNFCAQADSQRADQYQQWGKTITQGMTEKELADARQSGEYKDSYNTITDQLNNIPKEKAPENCHAALDSVGK